MSETERKTRGRPKEYDRETALVSAMTLFWHQGISAASLDDLSSVMKMNRPSIYRAFGNKDEIYKQSLNLFGHNVLTEMDALLEEKGTLSEDMSRFYDNALEVYCGGEKPLGCFMACVAVSDSVMHPDLAEDVRKLMDEIDQKLAQRCEVAKSVGDLASDVDASIAGQALQSILHTLAVRARAGQSKDSLRKLAAHLLERMF